MVVSGWEARASPSRPHSLRHRPPCGVTATATPGRLGVHADRTTPGPKRASGAKADALRGRLKLVTVALALVASACTGTATASFPTPTSAGSTTASAAATPAATDLPATTATTNPTPGTPTSGGQQPDDRVGRVERCQARVSPGSDCERPTVLFMPSGLPEGIVALLESIDGVESVTLVTSATAGLVESSDTAGTVVDDPPDGFVIPIEVASFATADGAAILSTELAEALAAVSDGDAVLSEASADLRRLDVGGELVFANGSTATVAAVLPTELVGSWEAVFVGEPSLSIAGNSRRQVALLHHDGTNAQLEEALDDRLANGFRIFGGRDDSETAPRPLNVLRVLPQITVKQRFGEFAYRPMGGGRIAIDPAWVDANIVAVDLPLIGEARCHRRYATVLASVLQGLVDDGLSDLIDPSAFEGCWNPRFIAGSTRLSRHAWGIAADINFNNPLDGQPGSPVHPELLARMEAAGVTSGHAWTNPDPGHFELVGS